MINKSETDLLNDGELLPVMEEFYSLQGEGTNTGCARISCESGDAMWAVPGATAKNHGMSDYGR